MSTQELSEEELQKRVEFWNLIGEIAKELNAKILVRIPDETS